MSAVIRMALSGGLTLETDLKQHTGRQMHWILLMYRKYDILVRNQKREQYIKNNTYTRTIYKNNTSSLLKTKLHTKFETILSNHCLITNGH